ncbi:MAG: hypothetical protein ABIR37_02250 [Candidatus Saccharimonadales bacterium]
MRVRNQSGAINILLIPVIVVTIFFIGALSFAAWAYQGRQDYKNNSDQKVDAAVVVAKQLEGTVKDKEFAEKEKSPLKGYNGPSAYGSLSIQYPKSWSAYVSDDTNSDPYVNGYFSPGVVPTVTNEKAVFALRVQVVQQSYSDVLADFQSTVEEGKATVSPYKLPKVPSVVGSRVEGQVEENKTGSMILLPMRDKTLKIWTNAVQYRSDLDTYILPNVTFSP